MDVHGERHGFGRKNAEKWFAAWPQQLHGHADAIPATTYRDPQHNTCATIDCQLREHDKEEEGILDQIRPAHTESDHQSIPSRPNVPISIVRHIVVACNQSQWAQNLWKG